MKPLLLVSSNIYDDSNIIDNIRQSCIDLTFETNDENVQILLEEVMTYLDKDMSLDLASEVFSLISSCLSYNPDLFYSIFNTYFDKIKSSPYYIISTASMLSYLYQIGSPLDLTNYDSFVNDSLQDILPQIEDTKDKPITVFNQEIPSQFKYELIVNLILTHNLSEDLILKFSSYIFSLQNESQPKFNFLINSIIKTPLITSIPPEIIFNKNIYQNILNPDLVNYITYLPDELFEKNISKFEVWISTFKIPNRSLMLAILKKCQKLNLVPKYLADGFDCILPSDLTPDIIAFLKKFNFKMYCYEIQNLITPDFPDFDFLFEIIRDIENMPKNIIEKYALKSNVPNFYYDLLCFDIIPDIIEKTEFWIHVYSVFNSKMADFSEIVEEEFVNHLLSLSDEKFIEILDEVLFSIYPPTFEASQFFCYLLKIVNSERLKKFTSHDHMIVLLNKMIEKKIIPNYMFMKLIDNQVYFEMLQKSSNPLLYYGYYFSNNSISQLKQLTVVNQSNIYNNDTFIEFIKTNDYKLICSLNDELLSFVCSALITSISKDEIIIDNLTKENILPFYSIVLNNEISFFCEDEKLINRFFLSSKISDLFKEGINFFEEQNNDDWPVLAASINSIVLRIEKFNGEPNKYLKSVKIQILELFSRQIIKNEKMSDKSIIFNFILNNFHFLNDIEIFQFIIHHFHEIESIQKNYSIINKEISDKIIENIQNDSSSAQFIVNNIRFAINFCKDEHNLKIEKIKNLKRIFNESLNVDDILLVSKFMIKNNLIDQIRSFINDGNVAQEIKNKIYLLMPINDRTLDELLSPILFAEDPENNDEPINDLFKRMMNEKPTQYGFNIILIETIDDYAKLKAEDLLGIYYDVYSEYKESFIEAFNHLRVYHPKEKVFVRVAKFDDFDFSVCEFGISVINKLYESIKEKKNNYQAFFCLKSIACTFPFLFALNPQQVFDIVLPAFDDYSLIFESNLNEEGQMRVKTAITALSFLLSALNSTQVIDAFFPWIFTNIEKFSDSQVFCFILTFWSVLKQKLIQYYIIVNMIKYNFLDTLANLIDRKLPEGLFNDNYYSFIYGFIDLFFDLICSFSSLETMVIDEFIHVENPIYHEFDHFLALYPFNLEPIDNNYYVNDDNINANLYDFMMKINKQRSFWIDGNYKDKPKRAIESEVIDEFVNNFAKGSEEIPEIPKIPEVEKPLTVKMVRYIIKRNVWLYQYILYEITIPLLPEHCSMIIESVNKMNEIKRTGKLDENDRSEEDIELDNFDTKEYYKPFLLNEKIIKRIANSLLDRKKDNLLYSIITTNRSVYSMVCDTLAKIEPRYNLPKDIIININSILNFYFDVDQNTYNRLVSLIILNLLNPSLRCDADFLSNTTSLLIEYKHFCDLPLRTTQLIGFLFKTNKTKCIENALLLCSEISKNSIEYTTIVQDYFEMKIAGKSMPNKMIYYYVKYYPYVVMADQKRALDILRDLLKREEKNHNNEEEEEDYIDDDDDDEEAEKKFNKNIIIELLNNLAPKRNSSKMVMSDSIYNLEPKEQAFSFQPIPSVVWELNPIFWKLFMKHRSTINQIIARNTKECKLFEDFPEIFCFNFRVDYFRSQMISRTKKSKTKIEVDRENILESSFNALSQKTQNDWNSGFKIDFINEEGIDAGGLLKDWLTRITKELFDSKIGLFESIEKDMSYQPSRLSYANAKHLEYFKFSGRIIAYALMNDIQIDVYLTRPFLKQILHRDVSFNDLECVNESIYNSFKYILDNDIESDPMNEFYFEIDKNDFGSKETIQLIENGSNVKVNNENKFKYVDLMSQFYLRNSIVDQINAFCEGFDSLIPHELIRIFTPNELSLLICGIPEIDVDDLRQNVVYEHPYNENTPVVVLFFDAIKKWSNEDLVQLLIFITGTSKVPIGGFKHFKDIRRPITIQSGGNKNRFPVAHACSNTLDLPPYETEEELNSKFIVAMKQDSFQIG